MSRNLELRSTFQFSGEGLGTLAQPKETRFTSTSQQAAEATESVNKNNYGVATLMSKAIFNALDADMLEMAESYCSKRLASTINKGFDSGKNLLSLRNTTSSLEGFEFNTENTFNAGCCTKFCLREGAHKGHIILHVPAFVPEKELNIPKDATNFKISARLISVSDFERNGEQVSINNKVQHAKVGIYETTMLPVLRISTQPLTAQLSIPGVGAIHNDVSAVLIMAIKFYSYKDSKFSFMPESGMMKIKTVH
ncbi:hypothetical protein SAMN04488029_1064 [Reichenbachiella faecimaris]|uniref:Uncharacterized protein n=1 Tax=Reichenbachiella faecimaris TaxID=692418 RepID=A0A1W2G7U8_REIFA|nr:hypothetical protein [Reichenbachiella faecimaris]SMD32713.1 hypothetical protein SAMN04488029_1064 [Reichenbachiella faecimaris]